MIKKTMKATSFVSGGWLWCLLHVFLIRVYMSSSRNRIDSFHLGCNCKYMADSSPNRRHDIVLFASKLWSETNTLYPEKINYLSG